MTILLYQMGKSVSTAVCTERRLAASFGRGETMRFDARANAATRRNSSPQSRSQTGAPSNMLANRRRGLVGRFQLGRQQRILARQDAIVFDLKRHLTAVN